MSCSLVVVNYLRVSKEDLVILSFLHINDCTQRRKCLSTLICMNLLRRSIHKRSVLSIGWTSRWSLVHYERWGKHSQFLRRLGLINDRAILVHMTQVNEKEIERVQEAQIAGLVHCPESNLKLGSGICPVSSLGTTNVCVGTDGASSNDDLDLLGEG